MNWLPLESLDTLDQIIKDSSNPDNTAIAIFKHSTRCPVSFSAKSRLSNTWNFGEELPIYHLDLIEYREISDKIATQFNITHQSPQILVIKNGECIYNASHISISTKEIDKII